MIGIAPVIKSTLSQATGQSCSGKYLAEICTKAGIKILGQGLYGVAIEDNGQVFKIFNKSEIGYNAFLQYLKGKSTVLLPKVEIIGTFGEYSIVGIERLHSLDYLLGKSTAIQFAEWASRIAWSQYYKLLGVPAKFWTTGHQFPNSVADYVNKSNMAGMLKKMAVWVVENSNNKLEFDLHEDNFMIRHNADGSKQIVLTDPF